MKYKSFALAILVFAAGYLLAQTERTNRTNRKVHDRTEIDTSRALNRVDSILIRRDSLRERRR